VQAHNQGGIPSTRKRIPFELVYWEGCLNQADATRREKYLKTAWGKRQEQTEKLSHGVKDVSTTMIYTHVLNRPGIGVKSPLD
jgi:predicted GIY-YIG superfamily endonuclease